MVSQGELGFAKLLCDLFPSLGTTGCPQNSHHSFSTGSPPVKPPGAQDEPSTGGALTWMAQLDHFHRVFCWGRGTGSRFLNVSTGLRMATTWGLSKNHQNFGDPSTVLVLAGSAQLHCLRVAPKPLSTLSRIQRIYLTQHHPFPVYTGSPLPCWVKTPFTQTSKTQSPVWGQKKKKNPQTQNETQKNRAVYKRHF